MTNDRKPSLLFLGNNYNPISVRCLTELLGADIARITIGIDEPTNASLSQTVHKGIRQYGLRFVINRARDLVRARMRIQARKLGADLAGYNSLEELAIVQRLPFFYCESINSHNSVQRIQQISPDVIVVAAFSQILKPTVIGIPSKGCINMHPSLLPRYRGPNPFYWILKNRESKSGVTAHYIDRGIDSGDIIVQKEFGISLNETEHTLRDKSALEGARVLVEALDLMLSGGFSRMPQKAEEATYYPLPPKGASRL